jgi:pimeloyl-ACP methyl ester carboxylesterase
MSRPGACLLAALTPILACSAPLTPLKLSPASPPGVENPSTEPPGADGAAAPEAAAPATTTAAATTATTEAAAPGAPAEGEEGAKDRGAAGEEGAGGKPGEKPKEKFACAPPDRGWGKYLPYRKIRGAKVSLPRLEAPLGVFDVYVHFHGADGVRRGFVHEGYPAVFVGVDLGEGSGAYRRAFDDPATFSRMLAEVAALMTEHTGKKARVGRVVLSSWSAGFGATTRIARLFPEKIHGLVLLDSLYAPQEKDEEGHERRGSVFAPALAPVLSFARRALAGERGLFLSYSNVPTIGYASTGEVAQYLARRLQVEPSPLEPGEDPRGQVATLDREGVHLRGFRGSDARAHCQHLRLAAEAAALLLRPAEKEVSLLVPRKNQE